MMLKRRRSPLNILYPRHCPLCHQILKDQRRTVCPECAEKIYPETAFRCMKCGRPLEEDEIYCRDCAGTAHLYREGLGIFPYDGQWRDSIGLFKYGGRREYGDFYASAMAFFGESAVKRWAPDVIVPVPLHPRKQRERGFNQSWYLAKRIGMQLGIPAQERAVYKIRSTGDQKQMNRFRRKQNLSGAFSCAQPQAGRSVLVVDDVYTTGSTMDAMAQCLLEAGAEQVFFLTLCIALL